ncbi:MAG: hypothetical protein ACLQDV_27615 [Candidatus Binataceae bacterium]
MADLSVPTADAVARDDWTWAEIAPLFDLPFADLILGAQTIHRAIEAMPLEE